MTDDPVMHLRWRRQQLRTNHQKVILCPHEEIQRPWTLAPSLVHQGKTVWSPGPSIRECCISRGKGLAIAAWWWEVEQRYAEVRAGTLGERLTRILQWQLDSIESLLEETVPKPSAVQRQRYIEYREDLGLVRVALDPPGFRQLGLSWPCTKEKLDKRWRELAQATHPDKGGNAQDFHTYTQAYRTAKNAFEGRP